MHTWPLYSKEEVKTLVFFSSALFINLPVTQLCSTLCKPMDCSPPGSFVHGIIQARILECVAILGGLHDPGIEPGSPTLQADSSPSQSPGKP